MNNNFPDINILPITTQNINGGLSIGGCELKDLVEKYEVCFVGKEIDNKLYFKRRH